MRPDESLVIALRVESGSFRVLDLGFLLVLLKERLKRNQTKSSGVPNRLYPVVNLKFVIDVGQVKIHRPLRNDQPVSSFLAGVALSD